jgi:hypothetical protein
MNTSADPSRLDALPADAARYDVIVVGAGASGIPAAIAAARHGARVVLLEEDALAGGAPVDSYVTLLCGGPKVGLFLDLCHRLNSRHDLTGKPQHPFPTMNDQCHETHWYLPSSFATELYAMMAAEPNLTLRCGSRVSGVVVASSGSRDRVLGVAVDGPAGAPRRFFAAPVTIDATGTGAVAAMAGCRTAYGRDARATYGEELAPEQADSTVQPCTWMYVSQRIRSDAVLPPRDRIPGGFVEPNVGWAQKGDDEALRRRNTGIYLHWGMTVTCEDTRDESAIARAQREALGKLEPVLALFREAGYAVHLAPRIGVREVRRVMGEYVVTANDLKAGREFDDTVAYNEFMLDVWGANLNEGERKLPRGFIPYRSLIPLGTEGLLIAGKAISGSRLAMGSYRVQPIVASIGTAAGVAAALAAQHRTGVRDIPVDELRSRLRTMGVL